MWCIVFWSTAINHHSESMLYDFLEILYYYSRYMPRIAYMRIYIYNNTTLSGYYILSPPPFRSSPVGQNFRGEEKNARWQQKIIISFRKYFHLHFIINPLLLAPETSLQPDRSRPYTPPPILRVRFTPIQLTRRRNVIIGLPPGALSSTLLRTHTRPPHKPTYKRTHAHRYI